MIVTLNITVLPARNATTAPPERLSEAFPSSQLDTFLLEQVDLGSVAIVQQDCCLFLFLDGSEHCRIFISTDISTDIYYLRICRSAHYFDSFLTQRTGEYQLQPGRVNGFPHYARWQRTLSTIIYLHLYLQPQVPGPE